MKFLCWLWALLSVFIKNSLAADLVVDCSIIRKPVVHPRECCDFPFVWIYEDTYTRCLKICPSIRPVSEYASESEYERDSCCFMRCLYSVQQILWQNPQESVVRVNATILKWNFRRTHKQRLSEDWTTVVGKTVDTCLDLYPPTTSTGHCLPKYFMNAMLCTFRENFINCPSFKNNLERCQELRSAVTHCLNDVEITLNDWDRFFF